MREIKALTTLRALAAFLVFMYHYAFLFAPARRGAEAAPEWIPLLPVWRAGQLGVSMFFVLSGFLITRLYFDRFASGAGGLRLYFVKRIARIWPLYLVLVAVQHLALLLRGQAPNLTWLVTCSMTQAFFRDLRIAGLPTAWSLTIEESFYAAAPVLYVVIAVLVLGRGVRSSAGLAARAVKLVGTLALLGAGLVATFGGAQWLAHQLGWTFGGFLADLPLLAHSTLAGRFPEFAIGIGCAFVHRRGDLPRLLAGRRASALALTCFVAIGVCMVWKDLAMHGAGAWSGVLASQAVAVLTGALILALSVERSWVSRALAAPLPAYLGKISYGFYLIQLSVVMEPLLALTDHLGALRLPALYVLMNLVCAALYELIERPARRAIVARWVGRAAAAASA